MMSRHVVATAILAFCLSGCGDDQPTPTSPSAADPTSWNLAGSWSGTTLQGRPVAFSVSSGRTITSLSLGYAGNGCSAVRDLGNLALAITGYEPAFLPGQLARPGLPVGTPVFGYASGNPEEPNSVQVSGWFTSATAATGTLGVFNIEGCGPLLLTNWSATER